MKPQKKCLVIQAAALGFEFLKNNGLETWNGFQFCAAQTVFPAVTCTAQASFRTGCSPSKHGMVGNGFFYKTLMRPMFWEQSAQLVQGPRIWEGFRTSGKSVAMLFWQQSLGEQADMLLSPAPIHKHHGGMIQDCYAKPAGMYNDLLTKMTGSFNLMHYWGPLASAKSSDWIASATSEILCNKKHQPDLCFTYLPVLDYDLQRFGPDHPKAQKALQKLITELKLLTDTARANNYEVLIFGDYAISPATHGAVLPNKALYDAGLFQCRSLKGMLYPDFFQSKAFAVVDHEIAHVYLQDQKDLESAKECLKPLTGVSDVLYGAALEQTGLSHDRSGDLVLVAEEGYWFAYPWWSSNKQAPDYSTHVDIHNKPGYDPCELFFGWPPPSVSRNTDKIKGTHGKIGPGKEIAWASSFDCGATPTTLLQLSTALKNWLKE